jgi:hypothetical protein
MSVQTQTIYQGEQLLAKLAQPAAGVDRLVVTFDHFVQRKEDFEHGKELFFAKHGVAHLHVFTRTNHWFQTAESAELARVLGEVSAGFREVVSYGSSMGAYGALAFSGALRANRVLAFSPQYSVDPAKVPFDKRWKMDRDAILDFPRDQLAGLLNPDAVIEVFYDPFHKLDTEHARLIQQSHAKVSLVRLPCAGHPVTHVLRSSNLLGRRCLNLLFDRSQVDLPSIWQQTKRDSLKRRVTLIRYLLGQNRDSRNRTAVRLIEQSESAGVLDPASQFVLGRDLLAHPEFRNTGLALMETAIARKPNPPQKWRAQVARLKLPEGS